MQPAGTPPSPDDCCRRSAACNHADTAAGSAPESSYHDRSLLGLDAPESSLPIQAARADAARVRPRVPFVVHAGETLFMVAEEGSDWVVAELQFDVADCAFTETHTARFHWPREAMGRLLSRAIVRDEIDVAEADRVSEAFGSWVAAQFVA